MAVISLGRSFGIVAANRGVRTTGFYRFVRHPLYGSYLVGYLGFLLGNLSIWNVSLIVLTVLCQYARARAEERVLLQDPAYQAYAQQVRYRFIHICSERLFQQGGLEDEVPPKKISGLQLRLCRS